MRKNDQKLHITIRNWEQHQREMRGGESRRRRRDWVAVSTDLYRDPEFLGLTIEQRYLWLMLLCHAGRVGPVFKLSASDARVLFQLRRSADFTVLKNQGFIDLRNATGQDRTGQDRTACAKKEKPPDYPDELNVEAWELYLQHRREMRLRKYTDRGAAAAIKKLVKHSVEIQMAAVQQTIENNWQGLFPEKVIRGNGADMTYSEKLKYDMDRLGIGDDEDVVTNQ